MTRLLVAILLCWFAASIPANAAQGRPHGHPGHRHVAHHVVAVHHYAWGGHHRRYAGAEAVTSPRQGEVGRQELPHPAGCPSVAFCGCGASIEVFGHSVRDLWLAANWFRFPPASPAPGMVAVRQHHVMVIKSVVGAGQAVVFDANSGHHRTQIHVVSLAGYRIVNPRGG